MPLRLTRPALLRRALHRWLVVAALWSLQLLPAGQRLALGGWWGKRRYRRDHAQRARVEGALQHCLRRLSPEERSRIARSHFEQQAHSLFDRGLLWRGARGGRRPFRLEGDEYLRPLLEAGRPVVFFTCRHTAQEFAALVLHSRYFNSLSVFEEGGDRFDQPLVVRGRLRSGGVCVKGGSELQIMRLVREGYLLLHPVPECSASAPLPARLFGVSVATCLSVARMARLCKAAVVPYMGYRRDGEYVVRLFPPLEIAPREQEARNAARLNAAVERMIARAPEQFLWGSVSWQPSPSRLPARGAIGCNAAGIAPAPSRRSPCPRGEEPPLPGANVPRP